ncbi:MAG TPA: hypothetical protein VM733_21775 [Thermoanaerobaculia bacterium]|nr:hypothetical protein [Thermoanaerobaculia bacterium]
MTRFLFTASLVLLFWLMAATLVVAARSQIGPQAFACAAAIGATLLAAFCYTRIAARSCDVSHALGVGIAWLVLSIAAEIALTSRTGHGWFFLLGAPAHPLMRIFDLFAWIYAPSLFARHAQRAVSSRAAGAQRWTVEGPSPLASGEGPSAPLRMTPRDTP